MKEIKLNLGFSTIVDDEDYEDLSKFRWYVTNPKYPHVARNEYISGCRPKGTLKVKGHLMHRDIMGCPKGMEVDHINGDGLDNRRLNLRVCTRAENGKNVPGRKGTSKYKGVALVPQTKRWRALIKCDYKFITIGTFSTQKEAAMAYDQRAKELFGEYARTNF